MLAWVAMDQSIDPHLDACASCAVRESVDPVAVSTSVIRTRMRRVYPIRYICQALGVQG